MLADYTKGTVNESDSDDGNVTLKSEYLNHIEVLPGHWLFTGHRHTMQFDGGDTMVLESTMSNVQVNQGLTDSLFASPAQ